MRKNLHFSSHGINLLCFLKYKNLIEK